MFNVANWKQNPMKFHTKCFCKHLVCEHQRFPLKNISKYTPSNFPTLASLIFNQDQYPNAILNQLFYQLYQCKIFRNQLFYRYKIFVSVQNSLRFMIRRPWTGSKLLCTGSLILEIMLRCIPCLHRFKMLEIENFLKFKSILKTFLKNFLNLKLP
jgi:hypothetical protein